jgi:hypothetical protein
MHRESKKLSRHTKKRKEAQMQIEIEIKSVYGKETFYPACEHSKMLCKLMHTKTLTVEALATLKGSGYAIAIATAAPKTFAL